MAGLLKCSPLMNICCRNSDQVTATERTIISTYQESTQSLPKMYKLQQQEKVITHGVFVRTIYKAVSGYIHNREIYQAEVKKLLDKTIML